MRIKLPVFICLCCLLSFTVVSAQPIPKNTLGVNGGMIITGSAGANGIAGGRIGVNNSLLSYRSFFFGDGVTSVGIRPEEGNFTAENKPAITASLSFNTLLSNDWEIGITVGKLFGSAKGTFKTTVNYDSTHSVASEELAGTTSSNINGWICELGVKRYFDASFHPFVGVGARYSTQVMSNSTVNVNGRSAEFDDYPGVDEFGGYISAGVKIPLFESFFFDAEAAGIIRGGTDYELTTSKTVSKISIEPALRIGISFDIGQYFGTERYGEEDEVPPLKAPTQK